jgi:AcrR family transcriptional regulator
MVDAARQLLAEGIAPTVEQAAERAAVSRTTAYRYFPNQRALPIASYPELEMPSLLDADARRTCSRARIGAGAAG